MADEKEEKGSAPLCALLGRTIDILEFGDQNNFIIPRDQRGQKEALVLLIQLIRGNDMVRHQERFFVLS